ncbi:MAG: hypothetical protein NT154_14625 [Verrucomicrobia bacterium]|nr:hypothetical protein [Verrucomicrobiota bacterium]
MTRRKPVEAGANGRQCAWWHNPCTPHQAIDDFALARWRVEQGATSAWLQDFGV